MTKKPRASIACCALTWTKFIFSRLETQKPYISLSCEFVCKVLHSWKYSYHYTSIISRAVLTDETNFQPSQMMLPGITAICLEVTQARATGIVAVFLWLKGERHPFYVNVCEFYHSFLKSDCEMMSMYTWICAGTVMQHLRPLTQWMGHYFWDDEVQLLVQIKVCILAMGTFLTLEYFHTNIRWLITHCHV